MRILIPLLTALLISSCSPQARLARLIKNHPELVKSDTVTVKDTVIIKAIETDTVIQNTVTKDTVVITKEKLQIRYYNDGKTIYLEGKVKQDTIIKEVPVIVNTVTPAEKYVPDFYRLSTWGFYLLLIIGCIVALCIDKRTY